MNPARFGLLSVRGKRGVGVLPAMRRCVAIAVAALCGCFLLACDREEIEVYQVPKTPDASAAAETAEGANAASETPVQAPVIGSGDTRLTYTLPPGWTEGTPGRMVLRSIDAGDGVTLSISSFPGDVGGMLANVNRWRRQLGLPPSSADALAESVQAHSSGLPGTQRVDLTNGEQSVLVDVVSHGGSTWFFKLAGPAPATEQQTPAFDRFMQSVGLGDLVAPSAERPS